MQMYPLVFPKSPPSLISFPKCCNLWNLQKIPLQISLFLSAAKITFFCFLPSLTLRTVWTENHLLESTSWEQQAWSPPPAWRRSAQTFAPRHSSFQPKPLCRVKYPTCLQKKVSKQLQYKISDIEGRKLKKKKKKRLTVGIYLGQHQWDFLRGKETFCALNVYLLCSSSKLGVYLFKQQQEPIHLFLPDCPCFFWHTIPWKWLRWSAVGGPEGLLKQVEAFVSQGKKKKQTKKKQAVAVLAKRI